MPPNSPFHIKFLSWNISGWQRKALDKDLTSFLSGYDIILLQETWSLTPPFIPGFSTFHIPAIKLNPKGRPAAGLCCLFQSSSLFTLSSIPSHSNYIQILLLQCNKFTILLFNLYIPPSAPSPNNYWTEIENLANLHLRTHSTASVLLMGDLNTRIGPNNIKLASHLKWDLETSTPPWFNLARSSKDQSINAYAALLANLSLSLQVVILNGTVGRDIPGGYTHFSVKGPSVIDYALASPILLPFISDFFVETRTDSDHLPLRLSLNLPVRPPPITPPLLVPHHALNGPLKLTLTFYHGHNCQRLLTLLIL